MGNTKTIEMAPYSITRDYNSVLSHIQANLARWYRISRNIILPVIVATHAPSPNFIGIKIQNSRYYSKIKRVLLRKNKIILFLKLTKRLVIKSNYRYGGLIDYIETP